MVRLAPIYNTVQGTGERGAASNGAAIATGKDTIEENAPPSAEEFVL